MITKLLVANRGEIAARVFRTAHALGISTVAVFSDADEDLPYVALADEAVRLPGTAPADTYLRTDLLLAAARVTGADAVHPGYGFLSENAGFARACAEAGLTFVGPSPEAIAAMGSKVEAKRLMEAAGVPVLPGAVVATDDPDELAALGARIGYPVLVKASFGGGGRGMRVVFAPGELGDAVASARREAAAAFGDGTVFLERFVVDPRHIEVQIFGDAHGSVVHLFERECSIQRRYQKIVEESPSPVVDERLRAALGDAAIAAGKALGYTGAGTVEFVVSQDLEFYFLEVNTRLQVEHPVTELVTGLDLVELQLRVAAGEPLPDEARDAVITGHAIEVRLYAEDVPAGYLPATGTLHAFDIPAAPADGSLSPRTGIRLDAGYGCGSVVGPHYDPMLAKVIGYGRTRDDAALRLARALAGARIHGVTTNRDLLVEILREPGFLAGRTDTGYLTRTPLRATGTAPESATPAAESSDTAGRIPRDGESNAGTQGAESSDTAGRIPRDGQPNLATHEGESSDTPEGRMAAGDGRDGRRWRAAAAALAGQATNRAGARVLSTLPSGWRSVTGPPQQVSYVDGDRELTVEYRFVRDGVRLTVDGTPLGGTVRSTATATAVTLEVDGVRRTYVVHRVTDTSYVDGPDGSSALRELPRFPDPSDLVGAGSLLAPMPGSVVRVLAAVGDQVTQGQPLIVLEAMKMEHTIAAPADGELTELAVAPSDQVDTGQLLAVVVEPE